MGKLTVGIAGLGRIGCSLFRLLYNHPDIELGAVVDSSDAEALLYLIRFDTVLGRFGEPIELVDGKLEVAGKHIPLLAETRPREAPWGELGVDIVVETSSAPKRQEEIAAHFAAGAKRVILCGPPVEPPDLTLVPGINDHLLGPQHRVISNASCTVHAAAPVIRVLGERFGIERAFLTTVHAYSDQQRLADVPEKDKRRGRAAAENIIPQETNAGTMLAELLPELAGRVTASSINVPVANGSCVDLVCWHRETVTVEAINEALRAAAAAAPWAGLLAFETEPIVSSDVAHSRTSGTFDAQATMVLGERVSKTVTWFDNSSGYTQRVVELISRLAGLEAGV